MNVQFYFILICSIFAYCVISVKYEPNWDSLDSRPLPSWYDEAKFGIFITWGVYSVPSVDDEWFWKYWMDRSDPKIVDYMEKNFRPDFTYQDFASMFTTEFYNPEEWADIFKASGAKYTIFVTKHCDGYTMWPSKTAFNWNSNATGPNRDLVGEFASALRKKTDIRVGLYHCLHEWYNPLYLRDKALNFTTRNYVDYKITPALHELVENYKPELIWSDICEKEGPASYFQSREFLAWLYNESPVKDTIVVNDRWCGKECLCHHGGYLTCNDRFNPGVLQKRKFEGGLTIDRYTWGYRRNSNLADFLSVHEIISHFASVISCGGNMVLNVGPTKEGKIVPIFEERLRQFGSWLGVNGEAVYSSRPWTNQNDTVIRNIWYTMKKTENGGTTVYAFLLSWPEDPVLKLGAPIPSPNTEVTMLGYPDKFDYIAGPGGQGVYVTIPKISWNKLPCQWVWVLKMTSIEN